MTTSPFASAAAGSGSAFTPHSDADSDDVAEAGRIVWRNRSILVAITAALALFGFAVVTPASKIGVVAADLAQDRTAQVRRDSMQDARMERLELRQERTDLMIRSNNAAWCVTLSPREAKLAQLDCGGVDRAR